MKEFFPNYYNKFKCIAGDCKHSCCIGWEIDIDDDTLELYNSLDGVLGDKIRKSIEGDIPHFKLNNERCPFLNEKGLCDIICEYGDGALCDICYLHPRFTNFYENFEETGLGISCEEAARIILSEKEKFSVESPLKNATKSETVFLKQRQAVIDILQDRSLDLYERFKILADKYRIEFNMENLYSLYEKLERLDVKWSEEIEKLKDVSIDMPISFEQLVCYFIFRHFTMDTEYHKAIKFSVLSCFVIATLWNDSKEDKTFEKLVDIARMYSCEIEYSDENIEKIMCTYNS